MFLENRFTTYSEKLFLDFSQYFAPYLREAGLPDSCLSDPCIEIPCDKHMQLFEIVAKNDNSNFGLSLGEKVSAEHFGLFGHTFKHSTDVEEYLNALMDYKVIYSQGINIDWRLDGELIEISYPMKGINVDIRQHVEFVFSSIIKTLSSFIGKNIKTEMVHFSHVRPNNTELHKIIFGTSVFFEQEKNKIFLDASLLKIKSKNSDSLLLNALLPFVKNKKAERENNELSVRLSRIIIPELHKGVVTIQQVSAKLGMSVRTLQRSLDKSGLNFSQVLTNIREQLTLEYLESDDGHTIFHISQMLGFKESSSLTRAFKRWKGISPNQYRRMLKSGS